MKTFALLLILFFDLTINAQMIENKDGVAFSEEPFFNKEFIKTNKIESIKGTYMFKKNGDIIRNTPYQCMYEFNSEGLLVTYFETNSSNGIKDTIHNLYEYDAYGNLIKHQKKDKAGYQTLIYTYDKNNLIVAIENRRDILDNQNDVSKSIYFNKEKIEYHDYGNQLKKVTFNSYNLPYQEEIEYFDSLGYLIETTKKYKMTSNHVSRKFEYNEKGLLAAIRKSSNINGVYDEELLFKYDDLGNLLEKHIYKNGQFISDIQIIYNLDTKLLSSILTRTIENNFIKILRFKEITFYE